MRFGMGWRAELGAAILANLDRIDAVELLAEEFDQSHRRALRFLRQHVAIVVHGTSLGLASTEPVDRKRLDAVAPLLENVATLIDPPFSTYDEIAWMEAVARATGCDLLLDLHNLHANATNFGFAPRIPHCRVGAVHIAGGKRIEGDRILDDHLHAVPDAVFAMLEQVSADLVILERDGRYPPFAQLLGELDRARAAA